jgi:hypothetical protein
MTARDVEGLEVEVHETRDGITAKVRVHEGGEDRSVGALVLRGGVCFQSNLRLLLTYPLMRI